MVKMRTRHSLISFFPLGGVSRHKNTALWCFCLLTRRGRLPCRDLFCSVFAKFSSLPPRVARATATEALLMGEQRENATVWRFLEAKSSAQGVPEAIYDCDTERPCGRTGGNPDQSRRPSSIPQKPVPCHSERALGRVELLRCAAKALWALAPCGIWDGRLAYIFVPRDPRGEPFAPRPRFTRVSTRPRARSR